MGGNRRKHGENKNQASNLKQLHLYTTYMTHHNTLYNIKFPEEFAKFKYMFVHGEMLVSVIIISTQCCYVTVSYM